MPIDAAFGVGDSVIDLRLPREVRQGERVDATVEVYGGSERHEVEHVYAALDVTYRVGSEGDPDPTFAIGEQELFAEPFVVEPSERAEASNADPFGGTGGTAARGDPDQTFDVTVAIPQAAPLTAPPEGFPRDGDYPRVVVESGLSIDAVLDPDDEDPLEIAPGELFETLHRAVVDHLDFELERVLRGRLPGLKNWTQRFEYEPAPGSGFEGEYEEFEVDLDYTHDGDGLGVEVQFDPVDSVPFELGEEYESFVVDSTDSERVARELRELARD